MLFLTPGDRPDLEVFEDTASGALRTRPKLTAVLAALEPGDTLVVWRLDRLDHFLDGPS